MKIAINPAELILARSPVATDGMNVAVDEPGRQGRAFGVDCDRCPGSVDIFLPTHGSDATADRHYGIGVENRIGEVAAKQKSDVADNEFSLT